MRWRSRGYNDFGTEEEDPSEFGGFVPGANNIPPARNNMRSSFMEDLRRNISRNTRTRPTYADCWLVGNAADLEVIEEYDTDFGHVTIGRTVEGETEYNLAPVEYTSSDALNNILGEIIDLVRSDYKKNGGRRDRQFIEGICRRNLLEYTDVITMACGGSHANAEKLTKTLCDIVYRYTVGLGIFDMLLSDPRLEDIYIDAPCEQNRVHVTLSGIGGSNSHDRCRTNLVVDRREVANLIGVLKRESRLPYCESNPVLETDMEQFDARATVVGYPLSPQGDAVAIRKHSTSPWTLTRLIANGTIDGYTAGLLSFLVQNRATFLVCGARGAGKSSLLSAMLFEFPLSQRILTIEDTMELPTRQLRELGYKVQSILMDERIEGDSLSKSNDVLRTSLRMGESALILGEVRGEEAKTLYESMRTGRAGSSIMGTIHGDSAKSVYDRVVHDMGISPEAFMATEVLVTLGTVRDRGTGAQIRRMNELVATADRIGEFINMSAVIDFGAPVMRRALSACGLTESEAREEIMARGEIRKMLAEKGKEDPKFLEPEWINVANEYVSRNSGKTCEALMSGFERKIDSME